MTLKIRITGGHYKGRKGKVVGVYMNGDVDVKFGGYPVPTSYAKIKKGHWQYVD